MKKIILIFFFTISLFSRAQDNQSLEISSTKVDSLFLEDQFYVSVTYNLVGNRPDGFRQYGFSQGFTAGFLKDIPVSKNRHWALGIGLGYTYNNIKQFINSGDIITVTPTNENIRTRLLSHGIELPFEIRWRNASPESHKFWRIYTGFKATYLLGANLRTESSAGINKTTVISDLNRLQYGAYVAFGFNTWNPYFYYGLNPIFKEGNTMRNFNVGFMFYIL